MATITRTAWIDDDGTGTSGTVINNAEKTTIYNQIDAALAQLAQLSGGNAFTGPQSINGAVTITAFATHTVSASGSGALQFIVRNTAAGAGNFAFVGVGNDTANPLGYVAAYSSTYASSTYAQASGMNLLASGAGGLSISSVDPAGAVRFYTNSAERMRIDPAGAVLIGTTANGFNGLVALTGDLAAHNGVVFLNSGAPGGFIQLFLNSAGATAGGIVHATATTVTYNTTSDQRLKTDRGRATDLSALRGVVVHDFTWTADGRRDRGVFGQEAAPVFPRAVTSGNDAAGGEQHTPYMVDYSKFVPDLIAGFQHHDVEIAALRAQLATLKG